MNHILKMSNAGGFTSATRYPDMLAGNTVWNPYTTVGSYDSIASITVGSTAQSSITFSNIPSTYTHLQVRGMIKNTTGTTNPLVTFNGDGATNYAWHQLYGDGASAGATASPTNAGIGFTVTGASQFGVFVMDILDYTSINKNKTIRSLGGFDQNGAGGYVDFNSGAWFNSGSAINSLTFTTGSTTFTQYSSFALYGVKA
jgi:hypothetical protein